ncbi:MAG: hypothetical protein D8M58_06075 [Calditrichaeota bacterium]|nr:MAG: hypothetical protein DWQ03_20430 [Calditrichota bacterium]MBL1204946.1 hypothetical protein [Calditrichota bacterium]NOG44775.1 hypothetical protein [Calditrichota bacterium]
MKFSKLILAYAILLIIDGLLFQFIAGVKDISLLTPIIFGGFILIMGLMSLKKDLSLFARHGATAVSLIAFIISVGSILDIITPESGSVQFVDISKTAMACLSLIFIIFAVRQFAEDRGKETDNDAQ